MDCCDHDNNSNSNSNSGSGSNGNTTNSNEVLFQVYYHQLLIGTYSTREEAQSVISYEEKYNRLGSLRIETRSIYGPNTKSEPNHATSTGHIDGVTGNGFMNC